MTPGQKVTHGQVKNLSTKKTKERKRREKEARRAKIIEAAKRMFLSQGFDTTTMKSIAIEVELSKGTLYNYFKSKDELYLAVAAIAIREMNNFCEKIDTTKMTDLEHLLATGYAIYDFSKHHPDLYDIVDDIRSKRLYFGEPTLEIHQKQINEEVLNRNEQEINKEIQRYQKLIHDPISKAIENKVIRDDLSPIFITCTLVSLTSGLIKDLKLATAFYEHLGVNNDEIIKTVFEWVFEGLKPRKKI